MSDIERWIDSDAPDEVRELIRAAHADRPAPRVFEKALAATAALSAASTIATGASAKALAPTAKLVLLKWGVGGALSGLVLTGGVSLALDDVGAKRAPAPVVASALRSEAEAPPAPAPRRVAPTAPSVSTKIERSAVAPRPAASFGRAPEADARLAAELLVIDRARAAVDAKDGARALAELAQHQREFGAAGRLAPEARYLRLEALLLEKDADRAKQQAEQILAEDLESPHARRAESVLKK